MISIVITTHGDMEDLPLILKSLELQRENVVGKNSVDGSPFRWAMGEHFKYPMQIIVSYDGEGRQDLDQDVRDVFPKKLEAQWTVLENAYEGKVGHNTRGPGIEAATGDWIVLTNSDNYFVQGWLHRVVTHLEKPNIGMVYWDIVSNLWKWGTHEGSQLIRGFVDLSCVCVRADIAKEVGFPFTAYEGDFDYIEACAKLCKQRGLSIYPIPEILGTHN